MSKKISVLDRITRILDEEMPKILQGLMDDKDLKIERKGSLVSLANSIRHQLVMLKGGLE